MHQVFVILGELSLKNNVEYFGFHITFLFNISASLFKFKLENNIYLVSSFVFSKMSNSNDI